MTVYCGSLVRRLPPSVAVHTTLSWRTLRIPYRLLGTRLACALHDQIVARKLKQMAGRFDIVHVWPLAAARTIKAACQLGMISVLERPNAHTRFAYEVVQQECRKLGISMPPGHEHEFNAKLLHHEELEYELADYLLCPSEFVARTFLDRGFAPRKLARHQYGFDDKVYFAAAPPRAVNPGLTMIFVGGCAPRKGLHYALDAWLHSSASKTGSFLIAGAFIPGYADLLSRQLSHPSVKVLGHRTDIADLMRQSDVLTLPSIEEGSALVTSEARGCGCVLLVSDAAGAICRDGKDGFIHAARDVDMLRQHIDSLDQQPELLAQMRKSSLSTINEITWTAAGLRLAKIYQAVTEERRPEPAAI